MIDQCSTLLHISRACLYVVVSQRHLDKRDDRAGMLPNTGLIITQEHELNKWSREIFRMKIEDPGDKAGCWPRRRPGERNRARRALCDVTAP